tara:strand:+ start:13601 stop:14416 length:816 start_codon:yes stop_codon:yes gene_type:complete
MANTGEVVVTKLRLYVDGNATKTVKRNAPGDPNYIPPFLDTATCIVNATAVTPTPTPVAPTPPTPTAPQNPTPTQCFYEQINVSATAQADTNTACADTNLTQTIRHNSTAAAFPNLGTIVWTDCGTTTIANGYYKVNGSNKVFRTNNGSIVAVNNCIASSNMPCTGKIVDVFLSEGKDAKGDFCTGTYSVNQTHLFAGATLADGLNQFICKNGQAINGEGKYYIVSLNPYSANPSQNTFQYWRITGTGKVVETGAYDCSTGSGGSGGGEAV